ncbi:MAG: hypothetical protein AAGG50_08455 [Bacteroidota bacterium]
MLPVLLFLFRVALVLATCACFCHNLARHRGLDPGPWAVMGAVLGPFGIPLVLLAHPPTNQNRGGRGTSGSDPRPPAAPRPPRRGPSGGQRRVRMPAPLRRVG